MMIFTIIICTLFLKSTIIDSTNPVTSYDDSSVRIKRNVDYDAGDRKFYTTPPFDSADDSDSIEERSLKSHIKNTNVNHNIIVTSLTPKSPRHDYKDPKPKPKAQSPPKVKQVVVVAVEDDVLEKLRAAALLRENAITIMGYLLQLPRGRLTGHQYMSLEMIYNVLRQRSVYLYNLLPVLKKMEGKSVSIQFTLLLNELMSNLPSHLTSTVKYLIKEINSTKIDLNSLLQSNESGADFLTGIKHKIIEIASIKNPKDELKSYDEGSKITEELLGQVYVKIFKQLSLPDAELPQLLFGIILSDLPNPDGDPIFEEYVRYIAKEALHHRIPNWSSHGHNSKARDPYTLLVNLVDKICKDEQVCSKMKKLLLYILNHIQSTRGEQHDNLVTTHQVNDLELLLSSIAPSNYDESIQQLGSQLQNIMAHNERINQIFIGINRYIYRYPREQILAFLAKLQTKLTNEDMEIERITSALLSNLILITGISSPVKNSIPLWMLMDVIDEPRADTKIREMINYITNEMFKNVLLWNGFQQIINLDKAHCGHPKECALNRLGKMQTIVAREQADPKLIVTLELLTSTGHQNLQKEQEKKFNCTNSNISPEYDSSRVGQHFTRSMPDLPREIFLRKPEKPGKLVKPPADSIFDQVNAFLEKHQSPEDKAHVKPATKHEPSPAISSKKPTSESKSPEISKLPPPMDSRKCIIFTRPSRGPPVVQTLRPGMDYKTPGAIILPSVVHLDEKPHNKTHLIHMCESQFNRRIVKPLKAIYGKDYIAKILGKSHWSHRFPTRIALMIDLLRKSSWDSRVQKQHKLMNHIDKTLKALEYVASYVLLPLVADFMDFDRPITWVTFANNTDEKLNANPTRNTVLIARSPPDTFEQGPIFTMPLVNPKSWLQPVEDEDPYPGLLPQLPNNSTYEVALRPLVSIFHKTIIKSLLGDDIPPSWYPNKGALFICTLHRLRASDKIESDKVLSDLIENYLRIILPPSLYVRVPPDLITKGMHESNGRWTVDLLGLMKALPLPKSKAETTVWNGLRDFLSKINLLDELGVHSPPLITPKGQFLTTIIKAALKSTKMIIDERVRRSLVYYKDKVLHDGEGGANVGWIWIQKFHMKTNVHIGEMIAEVIPYDDLPHHKKKAYNHVVSNLMKNPHLLEIHNELPIDNQKTQGMFVSDFLQHLLSRRDLTPDAKEDIVQLLPHVPLTGRGARQLPPFYAQYFEDGLQ